jgi:hypothetical protein
LVEAFSPEWNRVHKEEHEAQERASMAVKNFEQNIKQAQEFYRAVKEMEVVRAVNAIRSVQDLIAKLSDEKRVVIAKYHGTLRGGSYQRCREASEENQCE